MAEKLGDWLVKRGKVTREQLERALRDQAFFGERLGNTLVKLGFIAEDVLGEYLSDITHARYAPAQRLESIPADVVATVPARVAAKYCIIPFAIERRKLHLAMRDPKDLLAIDEIAFLTGMAVEPFVATEFRIVKAVEQYYQIAIGTKAIPVADAILEAGGTKPVPPPKSAPAAAAGPEIGLDGLPIDADPADVDTPFVSGPGGAPPTMIEDTSPLPASLDAWRAETGPQETPARPTPVQTPADRGAPAPPGTAPQQPPSGVVLRPAPAPTLVAPIPPGAQAAAVPAPAAVPPTMENVAARLKQADARDDVFGAILDYTTAQFKRAALFVVQQDNVLGWSGRGAGLSPLRIRNVVVPLDVPSLFVFFRTGAEYYYGAVPDLPANAKFYLDLGVPPPARVLLVPLVIKDKPSVLLYADNGPNAAIVPDIQQYRRLLRKAALALEVLILRNKIMMI